MTHIVGDSLIKSVRPDLKLELLDGKYTPRNRPIQDLVTYHEVGRRELRLNWDALLADVADTPVEPIQMHYMRVAPSEAIWPICSPTAGCRRTRLARRRVHREPTLLPHVESVRVGSATVTKDCCGLGMQRRTFASNRRADLHPDGSCRRTSKVSCLVTADGRFGRRPVRGDRRSRAASEADARRRRPDVVGTNRALAVMVAPVGKPAVSHTKAELTCLSGHRRPAGHSY